MSDRREHIRYEATFRVRFRDEESFVEEYTKNLSTGGMFIHTKKLKDLGSIVKIIMELPSTGEEVEVDGRVVHIIDEEEAKERGLEPGLGIQFINISKEFEEKLSKCFQSLSEKKVSDRRSSPRGIVKLHLFVEDPEGSEKLEEHYFCDFSARGLFLKTPKVWPEGTNVKLIIEIPQKKYSNKIEGEVKWGGEKDESKAGIGIEFKVGKEKLAEIIKDVIKNIMGLQIDE